MNRLQKLRLRRGQLLKQLQAIETQAEQSDTGLLTAEQRAEIQKISAEITEVDGQIEEASQSATLLQQTDDAPPPTTITNATRQTGAGRVTEPDRPAGESQPGQQSDPVTAAMQHAGLLPRTRVEVLGPAAQRDATRGFRSLGDFATSVLNACTSRRADPRLFGGDASQAATTFANENTGEHGGFAVPPQYEARIWDYVFNDSGSVLARMSPMPTTSNRVSVPTSEDTPWGGGVTADWMGEGVALSQKRANFKLQEVKLNKLGVLAPVTEEMLEDSLGFEAFLTRKAAEAINWKAAEALVDGDGNGKPLGYMESGALVTVAKESGQAADTIVAANVLKMYSRLINPVGAFWLVAYDAYPQIPLLTIGNQPIWTAPSGGLRETPAGNLLGLPIVLSDHNETLGDLGDIHLVSPSGYHARTKVGGVKGASSIHLYFDQDMGAFRWTFRLGGRPYATAPITPPKQTASTRSHFVTLAARA